MVSEEREEEVSYRVIWQNMPVVAKDSMMVGKVAEFLGDLERDIFDGIAVKRHLLGHKIYVGSEKVDRITNKRVYLNVSSTEVDSLPPYPQER